MNTKQPEAGATAAALRDVQRAPDAGIPSEAIAPPVLKSPPVSTTLPTPDKSTA